MQSDVAMTELLAREIWRYNECPWDFDNPPEGMAKLQKQIAMDHAAGLVGIVLGSAVFKARFAAMHDEDTKCIPCNGTGRHQGAFTRLPSPLCVHCGGSGKDRR